MRRLIFIPALPALLLALFPLAAHADKFTNTGPGTINTCDSSTRVGIGVTLPDDDQMNEFSQLTLGARHNQYVDAERGGQMQINGPSGALTAYFKTYSTSGSHYFEILAGDSSSPWYPIASWGLSDGYLYIPGSLYATSIQTGTFTATSVTATGIISATGEVRSTAGFRANGTLLNVPDFVFEPGYKLRSLEETERFVRANRHLPEIPSATEIQRDGLSLTEMNLKLLQKVEELTLHAIEQEKRIRALESRSAAR